MLEQSWQWGHGAGWHGARAQGTLQAGRSDAGACSPLPLRRISAGLCHGQKEKPEALLDGSSELFALVLQLPSPLHLAEPCSPHGVVSREAPGLAAPVLYDLPRFRLFGHVYCMKSCWLAGLEALLALGNLTHAVAPAMDGIFTVVFGYSICFLFLQQCKENRLGAE